MQRGRHTAQVNIDRLVIDRHYAARLCGVRSATPRQWILARKIENINGAIEVRIGDVYRG
jgi:nucleotidyltransferase/DNA polymerase involved in DNA repair